MPVAATQVEVTYEAIPPTAASAQTTPDGTGMLIVFTNSVSKLTEENLEALAQQRKR